MTTANTPISVAYCLHTHLKHIHGDTRPFSRNEVLRAIILKFQILRDFTLIRDCLESTIIDQGEKYSLIDPNDIANSLLNLFADLKKLAVNIPAYEIIDWMEWRLTLMETLRELDNSACFVANGSYRLPRHSREADDLIQSYIKKLSSPQEEETKNPVEQILNDEYLKITEAARKLGCNRDYMYKVHLKQGLKTVRPNGPDSHQKIRKSDLIEYMKNL